MSDPSIKQVFTRVFPPLEDIDAENERLKTIVTDLLNRFPSENNTNTLDYALNVLEYYCYVPLKYTLWPGRYVRYLNTSDAFNMKLKLGGFVLNDNGYTVTLRNINSNRTFKVNKRDSIWFMTMVENDLHRIRMNELIN